MATISSLTTLAQLDSPSDVFVIDDVSAGVTKKVTVGTVLAKIQDGSLFYAADAGSTDTYAITITTDNTGYTTGQFFYFKANTVNTGAATLNVNGWGAKTIKKNHDIDLSDGDIESGSLVIVQYDGTNMQMLSQLGNQAVTAGSTVTFTGNNIHSGNLTFSGNNTHSGSELFTGTVIAKLNAQQGFMINGKLSATVGGNALTCALKTVAGGDPSATDPVYVRIGNTVRAVTSALSVTLAAGVNYFNAGATELATKDIDYFVYLFWISGSSAVGIGFSRICHAITYNDFSATTTNEKYLAFNATPASSDEVEVVGRFNAINSGSAAYNWSLTTQVVISRPIFETRWLTWVPTLVGWSAAPTNSFYMYKLEMERVYVNIGQGSAGTSNSGTTTYTAPFTCVSLSNYTEFAPGRAVNNGSSVAASCRLSVGSGGTTIAASLDWAGNSWTAANGKLADGCISYRII